jgi:hypothetical protein
MKMAKPKKSEPTIDPAEMVRVDKYIDYYKSLLKKIDEIEEFKKQFDDEKQHVKQLILAFLDQHGMTGVKTRSGSVYVLTRPNASLNDPDAFMDYVKRHSAFDLMDRRANSTACREFADEHGKLPPGVSLNVVRTVGVRS